MSLLHLVVWSGTGAGGSKILHFQQQLAQACCYNGNYTSLLGNTETQFENGKNTNNEVEQQPATYRNNIPHVQQQLAQACCNYS